DAKKADQGIASLMNAIANTISVQMAQNVPLRLTNRQPKVRDLTINYVGIPLVSAARSGAPDGAVYVALYPHTVAAARRLADDAGWHQKSLAPFPGAEILGSQASSGILAAPMLLGMGLPAMSKSRESANRVKCASNLRQIHQGMILYANERKGKFPDTVEELY